MVCWEKAPKKKKEAASNWAVRYFMIFYKLKIKIIHINKYSFLNYSTKSILNFIQPIDSFTNRQIYSLNTQLNKTVQRSINKSGRKLTQWRYALWAVTSESESIRTAVAFSWLLVVNSIGRTSDAISSVPKWSLRRARFTSLILVRIMGSARTIFTFFAQEIPILRFQAFYAFAFEFVRRFFGTNTSIFVVTENVSLFTFHALPSFWNPKIRWVAFNANVFWCEVRSLNRAFAFSFFYIVYKCLWTCLAF